MTHRRSLLQARSIARGRCLAPSMVGGLWTCSNGEESLPTSSIDVLTDDGLYRVLARSICPAMPNPSKLLLGTAMSPLPLERRVLPTSIFA